MNTGKILHYTVHEMTHIIFPPQTTHLPKQQQQQQIKLISAIDQIGLVIPLENPEDIAKFIDEREQKPA